MGYRSRGPERKKSRVDPAGVGSTFTLNASSEAWSSREHGGESCSICRAGLCNASIRNARLAAIGCGRAIPEENSAATVVRRFTMCRRRWARACGCVPARWADTVRWGVHRDVLGSRLRGEIGCGLRLLVLTQDGEPASSRTRSSWLGRDELSPRESSQDFW
jgi:hypothetical protein